MIFIYYLQPQNEVINQRVTPEQMDELIKYYVSRLWLHINPIVLRDWAGTLKNAVACADKAIVVTNSRSILKCADAVVLLALGKRGYWNHRNLFINRA